MGCVIATEVCSMSTGKEKEARTTRTPQVAGSEGFLVLGGYGEVDWCGKFFELT